MNYFERAKFFKTKKRLGQNFLINPDVISAIIEKAEISPDDIVIEIGPGVGFVTEQLVKYAKKVIAIELDEEAVKELQKLEAPNLEIIHKDILKTDFSEYRNLIKDIILMVQEEVALRMAANENSPSKQYGLLTILSQFWADVEVFKKVGRKSFYPAPKVNSALVKLVVREQPKLELSDYKHFRKTVKAAFSQRRKNIKNCLLHGGFLKDNVQKSLAALNIDENTRGEKLSIETFGKLSEELLKNENSVPCKD